MPDTQTLALVIAGTLAGLICLRLYWVLGRRTGNEAPPAQPVPAPLPAPAAATPEPVPSSTGLLDIQLADRQFDTPKFLAGARDAYGLIVNGFAAGDREALRPLLSPDVMATFEGAIAGRSEPPSPFVKLTDARITGASLHGRHAEITVAFTAQFQSGTVIDVWTFARDLDSPDPNWTLVATGGDLPDA